MGTAFLGFRLAAFDVYPLLYFSLSLTWMGGCRGHGNGFNSIQNQDMMLDAEVVSLVQ